MVTLRRQRTDTIDYDELVTYARTSNLLWERVMEQRHTGVVPDDQIIDLRYGDLMRDPIPTIAGLYERLGVELSADAERRMRAYLAARPKDRHGAHRYSFDALPLDREATRRSLAAYMKEYDIEEEP
jgi:LPS sulfotransferase NodH